VKDCVTCRGLGYVIVSSSISISRVTCPKCEGRGFIREGFQSGNYVAIIKDELKRKRKI